MIPGRVRWQVNNLSQSAILLSELEKQLKVEVGVTLVHINPKTDRILVLYDHRSNLEGLEAVMLEMMAPAAAQARVEDKMEPSSREWPDLRESFINNPHARLSSLLFMGAASLSAIRILALGCGTNAIWRAGTLSIPALLSGPLGLNLAVLVGAAMLHTKVKRMSRRTFKQFGLDQERGIRLAIGRGLLHADLGKLEGKSTTDLANSIRTNLGQIDRGFDGAAELINVAANTVVLTGVFLVLAPRLIWLPLLTVTSMGVIIHRSYRDMQHQSDEIDKSRNDSDRILTEMTEGLITVKSYGMEKHFLRRIVQQAKARDVVTLKAAHATINYPLELELTTLIGLSAVTLIAGAFVVAGTMSPGTHIILTSVAGYMFYPFSNLGQPLDSVNRGMASYKILKKIAALPAETATARSKFPPYIGPRNIEFINVNFTYPEGRGSTLDGTNLDIGAGKIVAIVGESGSGKSTLIKLLQRFYEPNEGEIRIGGVDIKDIGHVDLRGMFACIDQRSYLFEGSLSYNIGLGKDDAGQEEIEAAAKASGIHGFISSLPMQYDTPVGVKGNKLSDGQRQRVLLARCFLKGAPILVLDEGTSNLDMATEREILATIRTSMPGHTVIFIAHRLPAIQDADQIIVMKSGRVIETGKHDSLVERNGAYYALWSGTSGDVVQPVRDQFQ